MINKRFTVSSGDINLSSGVVISVEYEQSFTSPGGASTFTKKLYPTDVQIINSTGAGVEWLFLKDSTEYAEYVADSSAFTFVRLPNGFTLQNVKTIPICYKMVVKGYEATATADLIVECINYVQNR
jgi:hypothetical protein